MPHRKLNAVNCHHNQTQCSICSVKWRLIEDFSVEHPQKITHTHSFTHTQHECKEVAKVRNLCTLFNLHVEKHIQSPSHSSCESERRAIFFLFLPVLCAWFRDWYLGTIAHRVHLMKKLKKQSKCNSIFHPSILLNKVKHYSLFLFSKQLLIEITIFYHIFFVVSGFYFHEHNFSSSCLVQNVLLYCHK